MLTIFLFIESTIRSLATLMVVINTFRGLDAYRGLTHLNDGVSMQV
jgi:hypothetical protein